MKENNNEIIDTNELIPGVMLIKELKKVENISGSEIIGILIYKIKLERMNILNLEVDFSSSKNTKLNNKNYKKIKLSIMPFETKEIAEIYFEKNFEINPKFNFNFIIPEKSIQIKYLKEYEENQIALYELIEKELNQYSFEYINLDEINQILSNLNIHFIDLDFIHNDKSLINENFINIVNLDFNYVIHWRRPQDFIINKIGDNNSEIEYDNLKIINNNRTPFINDIKQGLFPTNNLDCVLNALTEKNNLINRLIINKYINNYGIYKIRLCIKGEWITVIIDDYFPCIPFSNPITSNTFSNDLWVLLIQKALAKYFGNYYNLMHINIFQYLNILTGCPTILYNISNYTNNKNNIINFFNKLYEYIIEKNYLTIAISNETDNYLTLPEIGYTITDIINKNETIFVVLRINLFNKKNVKNIDDYIKKINKKYPGITNEYNNDDDLLILLIEDFLNEFKRVIICYTQKWEDVRIRGKFVDIGNESYNLIISKSFYNINLLKETNVIISLFQDDNEFIFNKNNLRNNQLDISLTIVKQDNENKSISLIKTLDFTSSSCIQMDIKLEKGYYIIFPRTSGCFFGKTKLNSNNSQTILYDQKNNKLSDIFINVIKDIFKKFDLLLNRYLEYKEFKGFWECIQDDKTINEKYFNNNILNRYQSYLKGITEKGFIDFFKDVYLSRNGKEKIYDWLNKLGYDKDLYSLKSRCFMINFHTETPIKVSVYNTLNTYLYNKIERLILLSEGQKMKEKGDIIIIQNKSLSSNIFSIGAINNGNKVYVVTILVNKKKGYIFSDKRNKIEKLIEPGKCEFYFHYYIINIYNNKKGEEINNIINLEIDYYSVD